MGAPYLPTLKPQAEAALDLLNLKKGQTLVELGSGDGRVLKLAAEKGYRAVGYEINPLLVLVSLVMTWKYRKQVRVVWGSFWKADLKNADGVFVFLIDGFMPKLDKFLSANAVKKLPIVSYTFKIPGKKAIKSQKGLFLYLYN